jgi:DNA-dependent protein kinase catalytic subunit
MVLTSLRRPKCLTIRGNDQKEHKFLVKGGEDQRQDQRIEILFELINDLLKSDSRCYQRNLSLKTYQVIPMTSKLALTEWLPDTRTLKEVILSARTEEEIKQWETYEKNPDYVYHHFIDDASKSVERWKPWTINDTYGMAYVKYSNEFLSKGFREIENLVPWDLLRRFIRTMSTNTESFYFLRNQFIMSYAVSFKFFNSFFQLALFSHYEN